MRNSFVVGAAIATLAFSTAALASQTPQAGATVHSADGTNLGVVAGAREGRNGGELIVRTSSGEMRAVPAAGATMDGDALRVAWSASQFRASPALEAQAAGAVGGTGGGNQATPPSEGDTTRGNQANDQTRAEAEADATRPATIEQQQAPDPR